MTGPNGIIDFVLHPSFNFMTTSTSIPSTIVNPLVGTAVLSAGPTPPGIPDPLSVSYGIVWAVSFAPPFAGVTLGALPTYQDRVFDLVVTHTLSSGLVVVTQRFSTHQSNGILFWENLLPSNVLIDVFPNFEVTLEWLIGV